jgi:hypothetical protein
VVSGVKAAVDSELLRQREVWANEFSLDNPAGALTRLMEQVNLSHGALNKDMDAKLSGIRNEFSLDRPDSALKRMVEMLRETQGAVNNSLTLDKADAPLARLRIELLNIMNEQHDKTRKLYEDIKAQLTEMDVHKAHEKNRHTKGSLARGLLFEEQVTAFVSAEALKLNDLVSFVGATTGLIKNCKVGDILLELGPDSAAPGAKIVVEVKDAASYNVKAALDEIETARKNRSAQVGVLCYSTKQSNDLGMQGQAFRRYGNDILVLYDGESDDLNVYLQAAMTTARALCVREAHRRPEEEGEEVPLISESEVLVLEKMLLDVEKKITSFSEIVKWTETIRSNTEKILKRVRLSQDSLLYSCEKIDTIVSAIKSRQNEKK